MREEGAAKQSKVHFVVRRDPNDVIKQIDAWLAQQGSPRVERGMAGNRGLSSPSYSQWVKVQCSSKLFGSLKR